MGAPPGSRAVGLVSRTRHAPVGGRPAGTVGSARALRSRSNARRRTLALGVVVTAGCLVAGCTGGGEPAPSPPVETSAEPSVTEVPEPEPTTTGPPKPERPAAMERDDAEGAAAAAEYFLSLYGYVLATGDTAEWDSLSHAECGFCADTSAQASWLRENDGKHSGGEMSLQIKDAGKYARDAATGIWPLDGAATQSAFSVTDASGEEIASGPATSRSVRAEVGRNENEWVIVEIAPSPEG